MDSKNAKVCLTYIEQVATEVSGSVNETDPRIIESLQEYRDHLSRSIDVLVHCLARLDLKITELKGDDPIYEICMEELERLLNDKS